MQGHSTLFTQAQAKVLQRNRLSGWQFNQKVQWQQEEEHTLQAFLRQQKEWPLLIKWNFWEREKVVSNYRGNNPLKDRGGENGDSTNLYRKFLFKWWLQKQGEELATLCLRTHLNQAVSSSLTNGLARVESCVPVYMSLREFNYEMNCIRLCNPRCWHAPFMLTFFHWTSHHPVGVLESFLRSKNLYPKFTKRVY